MVTISPSTRAPDLTDRGPSGADQGSRLAPTDLYSGADLRLVCDLELARHAAQLANDGDGYDDLRAKRR